MYREFGSLPIHREQGGIAVARRSAATRCPSNVWLRGRVSAMFAKATPEQRAPLEAKIAEEWKAVEAKKDLDAIRSFVGMFDVPFAVGREARIRLAETIMERNDRAGVPRSRAEPAPAAQQRVPPRSRVRAAGPWRPWPCSKRRRAPPSR